MLTFRHAIAQDEEALYAICLATGDAGRDASHLYKDGRLVGQIYAVPYLHLSPDTVFVAEDESGICGYITGVLDTAQYEQRLEEQWWPKLRALYPLPEDDDAHADKERIRFIHHPSRMPSSVLEQYPAHIHMNLLPRAQGKGGGSRLLSMWIDMARANGVPGIHLGANPQNHDGMAFWKSRGFVPLVNSVPAGAAWFGMKLGS